MESVQKDIYDAVLSGELNRIKELFSEVNGTEEQEELELFSYKDEGGRNALMTASMLGRSDIVTVLVQNGAQLDESTVRGEPVAGALSGQLFLVIGFPLLTHVRPLLAVFGITHKLGGFALNVGLLQPLVGV